MLLELRNISKSFGEKQVLKGISFKAQSGKAFGLLGRNGAGKTTTIRILMNVFPPDSGEVLIDGKPLDYDRIGIGYLPEERGLYPKKTILDQLVYFSVLKGMSRKQAVSAIDMWLERLEMTEYRNRRLDTLSKGNQQKIQLITALAHDPDIIILDEPFSGLDPVNAMMLKDVVREQLQKGKIVLFSSHQMSYIEEFCDSIAILADGRVSLTGDLNEIKRNYPRNRLSVISENIEEIKKDFGSQSCTDENGELLITLENEAEKTSVMRRLTENYDIDAIKVFEPSLNDIFVEHAGEAQKEERI